MTVEPKRALRLVDDFELAIEPCTTLRPQHVMPGLVLEINDRRQQNSAGTQAAPFSNFSEWRMFVRAGSHLLFANAAQPIANGHCIFNSDPNRNSIDEQPYHCVGPWNA